MADGVFEVKAGEFLSGLVSAIAELTRSAEDDLVERGEQVAERASQLAPRGATLDLENAIGSTGLQHDRKGAYVEVGVNVNSAVTVDYGFYEEFGSVHNPPQPFMRPALAEITGWKGVRLQTSGRQRRARQRRLEKKAAKAIGTALMGREQMRQLQREKRATIAVGRAIRGAKR